MLTAATSAESPIGTWNLQVDWPTGRTAVVLTVTRQEDRLAATWIGPQGQLTADNVSFADDLLRFALHLEGQNRAPLTLRFEAKLSDNKIEGHLTAPRGQSIAVKGQRKPPQASSHAYP